jgi:hypothetical protein
MNVLLTLLAVAASAAQIESIKLAPEASPLQIRIVDSPASLQAALPTLDVPGTAIPALSQTGESLLANGPMLLINHADMARTHFLQKNYGGHAAAVTWGTRPSPLISVEHGNFPDAGLQEALTRLGDEKSNKDVIAARVILQNLFDGKRRERIDDVQLDKTVEVPGATALQTWEFIDKSRGELRGYNHEDGSLVRAALPEKYDMATMHGTPLPGGKVLVQVRRSGKRSNAAVFDPKSGDLTVYQKNVDVDMASDAFVMPNGKEIVYKRRLRDGTAHIVRFDYRTGRKLRFELSRMLAGSELIGVTESGIAAELAKDMGGGRVDKFLIDIRTPKEKRK